MEAVRPPWFHTMIAHWSRIVNIFFRIIFIVFYIFLLSGPTMFTNKHGRTGTRQTGVESPGFALGSLNCPPLLIQSCIWSSGIVIGV